MESEMDIIRDTQTNEVQYMGVTDSLTMNVTYDKEKKIYRASCLGSPFEAKAHTAEEALRLIRLLAYSQALRKAEREA
jgi:hypothetical protein